MGADSDMDIFSCLATPLSSLITKTSPPRKMLSALKVPSDLVKGNGHGLHSPTNVPLIFTSACAACSMHLEVSIYASIEYRIESSDT